jgi:hypothetical protein
LGELDGLVDVLARVHLLGAHELGGFEAGLDDVHGLCALSLHGLRGEGVRGQPGGEFGVGLFYGAPAVDHARGGGECACHDHGCGGTAAEGGLGDLHAMRSTAAFGLRGCREHVSAARSGVPGQECAFLPRGVRSGRLAGDPVVSFRGRRRVLLVIEP